MPFIDLYCLSYVVRAICAVGSAMAADCVATGSGYKYPSSTFTQDDDPAPQSYSHAKFATLAANSLRIRTQFPRTLSYAEDAAAGTRCFDRLRGLAHCGPRRALLPHGRP